MQIVRMIAASLTILIGSGCASEMNFAPKRAISDTAVIRHARPAELQQKFSFVPFRNTYMAQVQSLIDSNGQRFSLYSSTTARVSPGVYTASVNCTHGRAVARFEVRVDARAGNTYLVECLGYRGNDLSMLVREVKLVKKN